MEDDLPVMTGQGLCHSLDNLHCVIMELAQSAQMETLHPDLVADLEAVPEAVLEADLVADLEADLLVALQAVGLQEAGLWVADL